MRIGIDARLLLRPGGGIGRYAALLIEALARRDQSYGYVLFTDRPGKVSLPPNFSLRCLPSRSGTLWTQVFLPGQLDQERIELYHATSNFDLPVRRRCRYVTTVHDLACLLYPEWFPWKHRLLFRLLIGRAVRTSEVVLADSQHTERELREYLDVPAEKISVAPLFASESFSPLRDSDRIAAVKRKHGLKGEYLLFVGVLQPKKNVGRLVEAFSILRAQRKEWRDLQLAIAGSWGWGPVHPIYWVDKFSVSGYVVVLGHVPEDEMVALYSGARLFVLPSLHEGFGLPLLEAMACGTPVICSNVGALPEVVGSAALLFDPTKPEEIADAARRVLDDTALQARLIAEGHSRVRRFSAESMASATLGAYQRACAGV